MEIIKADLFGSRFGTGITAPIIGTLHAVLKSSSPDDPYLIANEYIAAELARWLRLPAPPCCVTQDSERRLYFASLNFNLTGLALPPIIPNHFHNTFPRKAGAIVAFDVYIANSDRHAQNLCADYSSSPARYNLFDHSHALLGSTTDGPTGEERLGLAENRLGIDGLLGGKGHCLTSCIVDDEDFMEMLKRIADLRDYLLEDLIESAGILGVPTRLGHRLLEFLRRRRGKIRHLILENKEAFSNVRQWRLRT
jgi:hypothetical protein